MTLCNCRPIEEEVPQIVDFMSYVGSRRRLTFDDSVTDGNILIDTLQSDEEFLTIERLRLTGS